MRISISELSAILKECKVKGNASGVIIDNFAPIEEANDSTVAWVRGISKNSVKKVKASKAPVVLVSKVFPVEQIKTNNKVFFLCENPRLSYSRLMRNIFSSEQKWIKHKSAIIHPNAKIDNDVFIGPHSIIGDVKIGKGSVIHGHCFIHDNVEIGSGVHLHAHTCVGSDGFSFEWNSKGKIEKLPHIGRCIIEDDVEIFPFANIDRGTLGTVRIGKGTKIDHYAHIGHNCTVGQNTIITAGVVLCGGSHVHDNVWIGVQTTVKQNCVIGSHSFIGLNSLVTRDVPENEVWAGAPAKFLRKNNE